MDHSRAVSANNPDSCFVGGRRHAARRAMVVRARDGAELGTAVHEFAPRRDGRPRSSCRRGADYRPGLGAAGSRRTTFDAPHAVPACSRRRASTRPR